MRKGPIITVALLALAASIGLGAFLSRPADRPAASTPPTPRTDKAPLAKRFPFLGNFEKCSWVGGVKDDRSKELVPAPSSYYLKGFVVLDPAQTNVLVNKYK